MHAKPSLRSTAPARRLGRVALPALALVIAAACGNLLDAPLPAGVVDPASFRNEPGATARFHEVVATAPTSLVRQMVVEGTISDEFQDNDLGGLVTGSHPTDERMLPERTSASPTDVEFTYTSLQALRGNTSDAIGLLRKYAPKAPRAYIGELFALAGYAEIGLADLYCSGVPLSTLDFEKDFTYAPSSSTTQVYAHAVALFDTAIGLSADSAPILNLARVGRGRALLAQGKFTDAESAVQDVPDGFVYQLDVNWEPNPTAGIVSPFDKVTVADVEGQNGQPFVSAGDPRTPTTSLGVNRFGRPIRVPSRYRGVAPYPLADWTEARLIAAEAELKAGNTAAWLAALNALRETAISPALPDTTDPGADDARIDLTFHERAMWLFATGHRQGDLRRLMRQYGRRQEETFPTGTYPGGQGVYGIDVNLPIPPAERLNPLFNGCINRAP